MNKNLFLFAAAAALTFTACSDNDDMTASRDGSLSSNENTAVQFSTYLAGQQSRATGGTKGVQTTTTLKAQGFGVMAFSTETTDWTSGQNTYAPNFMYNQEVKIDGTGDNWTYSPIKYWPNDFATGSVDDKQGVEGEANNATGSKASGKVSFFAYAPYKDLVDGGYTTGTDLTGVKFSNSDYSNGKYAFVSGATALDGGTDDGIIALTTNDTKNDPLVRYGLSSQKYSENVDLLWGLAMKKNYNKADGGVQTLTQDYNINLTKQAANEKIGFSFKHALAKLGGNTDNGTGTTTEGNHSKVKVILDLDNGETDASTAITGGKGDFDDAHTTLVTINSIKIQDWATYSTDHKYNGTDVAASKARKYGWFNIATGKWSDAADGDKVEITTGGLGSYNTEINGTGTGDNTNTTYTKLNAQIAEDATGLEYDATNKVWKTTALTDGIDGVTTIAKEAYADIAAADAGKYQDEGIVMIPGGDPLQLVVTIDYTVRTYDSHLAKNGTEGTWTKVNQVITNLVSIPADAVEANKVYSLLIHLGLTSVKFTAEVSNWEDGANPDDPNHNDNGNSSTTNNKSIYLPSNTIATSLTASAGATTSITVPATTESFTINLTGLTAGNSLTADPSADVTFDNATVQTGGKAVATVKLTANTSTTATQDKVVTITEKNGDDTVTTTKVTITQAKATE